MITEPSKLIRIASMTRAMLEEVRQAPLDEAGRLRLLQIYEASMDQLRETLSDELREELASIFYPLEEDTALLRAPESGRLLHRKGVTFRGVELPDEPNPTERDLVDLAGFVLPAVLAGQADFVALSFVRNARDVLALRSLAEAVTRWFRDG